MKNIKINDTVTLRNGNHVKIIEEDRNPDRYLVVDVEFGYTGIKLKSIQYGILKSGEYDNEIIKNHGFIKEGW